MEEILELDSLIAGNHISQVIRKAIALATKENKSVHFQFNEVHVVVAPGEQQSVVLSRWEADCEAASEAYRNSPEYKAAEQKRAEDERKAREVVMLDNSTTEAEMRVATVPWPKTEKQLGKYVASLVGKEHDYGTCVFALSMAAQAAFNYVAGQLGVTGFQSSMADLDFIRRSRNLEGPFMLIAGKDALYPQYDLPARLQKNLDDWRPWLKEEAMKLLAQPNEHTHPDVIAHWRKLAGE